MDQLLQVGNIKNEPTSTSTNQSKNPTEMQLNSIKQESDCLFHSEMHIKMEPQEDENEFPIFVNTSYDMSPSHKMRIKTEEPLIKIKCEDLDNETMQDPLDVSSEIKVEERRPTDLEGETGIKTEPTKGENYDKLLERDQDDLHKDGSQDRVLIRKDPDHKDKKYICNECNKAFKHKCDLARHLRIHSGIKPYTCNFCEKSFTDKGNLVKHMLIHSSEKPYSCDECKKVFNHKSHLKDHKLVHSGEKPFSCDVCNKSFAQKTNLVSHKRIHTGEKPYVCDMCNVAFTYRSVLNQHRRLHTGEKPYSCNICTKSFADKGNLIRHKKIHKN